MLNIIPVTEPWNRIIATQMGKIILENAFPQMSLYNQGFMLNALHASFFLENSCKARKWFCLWKWIINPDLPATQKIYWSQKYIIWAQVNIGLQFQAHTHCRTRVSSGLCIYYLKNCNDNLYHSKFLGEWWR